MNSRLVIADPVSICGEWAHDSSLYILELSIISDKLFDTSVMTRSPSSIEALAVRSTSWGI